MNYFVFGMLWVILLIFFGRLSPILHWFSITVTFLKTCNLPQKTKSKHVFATLHNFEKNVTISQLWWFVFATLHNFETIANISQHWCFVYEALMFVYEALMICLRIFDDFVYETLMFIFRDEKWDFQKNEVSVKYFWKSWFRNIFALKALGGVLCQWSVSVHEYICKDTSEVCSSLFGDL